MKDVSTKAHISIPDDTDFQLVKFYVSAFELDARDLHPGQFLIAKNSHELLGFGRIRIHDGCDEFCTLGIIPPERGKGVGKQLIRAIVAASTQPLYLACIIPSYFENYGFKTVAHFPFEMQQKLDYCNASLPVKEQYVVMKYFN